MTRAKEGPPTGEAIKLHAIRVGVGSARVRAAMDHVQQAQVELNLAMMDMCSVIGYVTESDKLRKHYDAIKSIWYKLDKKLKRGPTRNAFRINELDHQPADYEIANPHAGGCGRRGWRESFFSTDPDDEHADCETPCGLVGCDPDARRKA